MECLLPYLCMVTVPHIMVGLGRMLDYRGVRLARFHCIEVFEDFLHVRAYSCFPSHSPLQIPLRSLMIRCRVFPWTKAAR